MQLAGADRHRLLLRHNSLHHPSLCGLPTPLTQPHRCQGQLGNHCISSPLTLRFLFSSFCFCRPRPSDSARARRRPSCTQHAQRWHAARRSSCSAPFGINACHSTDAHGSPRAGQNRPARPRPSALGRPPARQRLAPSAPGASLDPARAAAPAPPACASRSQ